MKFNLRVISVVLIALFVATGCKKDKKEEQSQEDAGKELFVSANPLQTLTKVQLQTAASLMGFGAFSSSLKYDVDFYRFIYNTTFKGRKIQASGLLCVPGGMSGTPAMLSAQHGTIFADFQAPSAFNFPGSMTGFELFASTGFVTVIPDFIGYGVSKDIIHPYYDMQSSGQAVVDMIKAAKYYLKSQNKSISEKLFLIGYSEGGYVTMAAQREIETNASHKLTVTAAAEGAGGYDISGMLATVATKTSYPDPSFFALFIQNYNTLYGFNRPLTDYFKEPFASRINTLLDGTLKGDQINAQLTLSLRDLFNTNFFNSLNSAGAEAAFKAKVAENSFPNWAPKSATRLYHGTADENVYYQTSESTYNRFLPVTGSAKLSLIPIPGGNHGSSVVPMMGDALQWFSTF
ncbi:alpha/beta hydrolase [Mucilaginibacter aquatilis]|uniref:Prolyl oligopeptidase family serine peptidase n=1 Tax=Mucilaginibacter aquatilis TaxID=1517760 RepID=A0A6I4I800_9SPHI|nr:lipase family protein [Mucilaginibacter aquatilis]MVN91037.1 prolyl oligopeptidase family serine peptidase [Mucilaginibacter aquatilis]